MLRISKLTDYGTVILAELASARDASVDQRRRRRFEPTGLGLPTVQQAAQDAWRNPAL